MSKFKSISLCMCFLLAFCASVHAEPPSPTPEVDSTGATKKSSAPKKQTYQQWLEKYQAWDKLERSYGDEDDSKEAVLKKAQIAMRAGNPRHALEVIESTQPFEDDNATEAERLWIGAQAYRSLGNPEQAIAWHLEACDVLTPSVRKRKLISEPGLEVVWKDVFRKLFQVYIANEGLTREAQGRYLERMISQASEAWTSDKFWTSAQVVFARSVAEVEGESPEESAEFWIKSHDSSRLIVSRALAGVAAGRQEESLGLIESLDTPPLALWGGLVQLIEHGDRLPDGWSALSIGPSRAAFFIAGQYKAAVEQIRDEWNGPEPSQAYEDFMRNCRSLSLSEMYTLLQEERAESLMIDTVPAKELKRLFLALAIATDDREQAKLLWRESDPEAFPNSLKLAIQMYFELEYDAIFSRSPDLNTPFDKNWMLLLETVGHIPPLPHQVNFWQIVDPAKNRSQLIHRWPLDMDVMLVVWKYDWEKKKQRELARRITYLYPEEQFGMLCGLYLAEEAISDKQLSLSEYYLNGIDPQATNSTLTAEYHRVTAELLIHKEDMEGAYQQYQRLVASGAPIDDTTRLKIAFLLQQRGELAAGRQHLLRLWERKTEFDSPMQAEILFYLAEGEQALGLSDKALDYYLQLAWEYPQESMWALTAMYRAATIYESRKQYAPASKLLKTVVKNAQTGKQKEAAQARLEAIQARQAKSSGHGAGSTPYPF